MRTSSLTVLALVALASARRHDRFAKRFSVLSDQYATETEGSDYLLSNNLWGMYSGSGSQTTEALSLSGGTIGWETTYTWADASSSVKSYANVGLETGLGVTLESIGSLPSTWSWSYTKADSDLVADVSFDLWLSEDSTCGNAVSCSTYEIMIWLSGRNGCVPAGSYSETVTVGGKSWKLWTGTVQTWNIISFVAVDEISDFDMDLMEFFDYITENNGVSSSQYLTTVQAGTEPFTGSATLTTSSYSVSVVAAGAEVASSSKAASKSSTTAALVASVPSSASTSSAPPTSVLATTTAPASSSSAQAPTSSITTIGHTSSNVKASSSLLATRTTSSKAVVPTKPTASASSTFSFSRVAQVSSDNTSLSSTATPTAAVSSIIASSAAASASASAASGTNYQTYTGSTGGYSAPAVTSGGRGYLVAGVTDGSSFLDTYAARDRSCDMQHNTCANAANAAGNKSFSVGDCDTQNTACKAANV